MPSIYDPNNTGFTVAVGETYDYAYPLGMDLKPGSEDSAKILNYVNNRARDAQSCMRGRYEPWKKCDRLMNAFIPADLENIENLGDNEEIKPVVPMGFALVDTLLAQMVSLMTGGPFFKTKGVGPEDRKKAMLAELVLNLQFQHSQMMLAEHTQWRDMYVYGMGIVSPSWQEEIGNKIILEDGGAYSSGLGEFLSNGTKVRKMVRTTVWEGNGLDNWSPYGYLPDPNLPVHLVQKMQYVGCAHKCGYHTLLTMEENFPETYFNVRYLEGRGEVRSEYLEPGEWTESIRDYEGTSGTSDRVDVVNMYCKLVPKSLGIKGLTHEYPEMWLFTIAGDGLIIRAQPVDYAHNEYPVAVAAPTYDGYSTAPTSLLEMMSEMLRSLDWYYRSHFYEVRKSLHNRLIIDPWLVNYAQVIDDRAGQVICLREHVWGRGVKDAVEQLNATDFTRNHMNDAAMTLDLAQRVSGAVTQLQGVMETKGERRSATESRDTRLSALGRVGKQALICALQSTTRIGRQCLFNTQQFMKEPLWIELTGRNQMELSAIYPDQMAVMITPEDLIGDIDIIMEDPSGEGGEYLPEAIQLYTLIQGNLETAQQFDSVRMMLDLMRMAGKKNPTQFLRNQLSPQFMPNEEVLQQADAGNLIPLGEARSGQGREAEQAQKRSPGGGTSAAGYLSDTVKGALGG